MKNQILLKFLMLGPVALSSTAAMLWMGYGAIESIYFGLLTQLFFSSRLAAPETRRLMKTPLLMATALGILHFFVQPLLFQSADSTLDRVLILVLNLALLFQSIFMGWHQFKILQVISNARSRSPIG